MEKRRRARINNCLNELKTLILDAMKKDPARHSKLEKADILEMTVKYLENLQRQQSALSQASDPNIINKFKAGFSECANEVNRFPGLETQTKRRLLQHLSNCLSGVKSEIPQLQPAMQQVNILPSPPSSPEQDHSMRQTSINSINSNGYFLTNGAGNGVQLIPTKLSNGNIAFVVPNNLPAASTPLPMLVPIPTRTASTCSATSNNSHNSNHSNHSNNSSTYETAKREHSPFNSPPSPANSSDRFEPMDCSPSAQVTPLSNLNNLNSISTLNHAQQVQQVQHMQHMQRLHQQQNMQRHYQMQQMQQQGSYSPESPISLVMKKDNFDEMKDDEQVWRPW